MYRTGGAEKKAASVGDLFFFPRRFKKKFELVGTSSTSVFSSNYMDLAYSNILFENDFFPNFFSDFLFCGRNNTTTLIKN